MFNFGLFLTHIPYTILAAAYSLWMLSFVVNKYMGKTNNQEVEKIIEGKTVSFSDKTCNLLDFLYVKSSINNDLKPLNYKQHKLEILKILSREEYFYINKFIYRFVSVYKLYPNPPPFGI